MKYAGVRIHHPELRNCVFTLTQFSKPMPQTNGYPCPMCKPTIHFHKTFHLILNEHGDVCVHPDIYELFKREGMVENLKAVKEVTPAPTTIKLGENYQPPTIISREQGPVKGAI